MKKSNLFKKVVVLVVSLMFSVVMLASSLQERRIEFFVNEAVKEFSLSENKKAKLQELRTDYYNAYKSTVQERRNGFITPDEAKVKVKKVNQNFRDEMVALTGKTYKELEPFFLRVQQGLRALK